MSRRAAKRLAALLIGVASASAPAQSPIGERLGGDTSVVPFGDKAFALPAGNLDSRQMRDFFFGNRLFNTNWTIAPGSVEAFDGLGPLFNRVSCSGCHVRDGRGGPPEKPGDPMLSMLVRLSIPGVGDNGGIRIHPVYGDQLQDNAIPGIKPEGRVWLSWEELGGAYADGRRYTLVKPRIEFRDLAYGPLGEDVLTSPRVAPAVFGLGLLEAVPEATILALADPEDRDGDGISGRPNRSWDGPSGSRRLGRFGWKANVASLRGQAVSAASGDIGLTSSIVPHDGCTPAQTDCTRAINGGTPELSDEFVDKLVLYTQTLGVPMRREVEAPQVLRGEQLFSQAGCSGCHTVTLHTGAHEVAALANQTIHPFTDLLLHDMGEGLADGRPDFDASGREWRTPPLWGIGLFKQVNGHTRYLHDGRARNLEEAVLWHGGEAQTSRDAYARLPAADRAALLRFLESL